MVYLKTKNYPPNSEMTHFFLNYGGPGGKWFSDKQQAMRDLDDACKKTYGWPIRRASYVIHGLKITVHTYGLHRALSLEVPKGASPETTIMFEKAKIQAQFLCTKEYALLRNNCVSAVAAVLNELDNNTVPPDIVFPWSLDAWLKQYCGHYATNKMTNDFIGKYQEKINNESFSFFRKRHWLTTQISSAEDIILHAYGKTGGTGERTKSTLLELGWVSEDTTHLLIPTPKAPLDFQKGLTAYNQDYKNVCKLKKLYRQEAGFFSYHAYAFFKDQPDYATALDRLKEQAVKNPKGASASVLRRLNNSTDLNEDCDNKASSFSP